MPCERWGGIVYYAQRHPTLEIEVSPDSFVDLLDSLDWTDRNKALAVLDELTRNRNQAILGLLRERALLNLVEMARWKYEGHAVMPFVLLGRLADLTDEEIAEAWKSGEKEAVFARALKSRSARK